MKLFFTFLLILFLSFAIFSFISYVLIESNLSENHRHSVVDQVNTVAEYIQHAHEKDWSQEMLISSLEMSIARQDKVYYVLDETGRLVFQAGQSPASFSISKELYQPVFNGESLIRKVKIEELDQFILFAAAPIEGIQTQKAVVMVSYGFEKEFIKRKINFIVGLLVTIGITALTLFFISKRLTSNLTEMSKISLQFAKGRFDQRIRIDSKDEIGQLGVSLNYMAEELASLDQMRKDFVANVSHDLRSPLTSIHGFAEALIDGTIPNERQHHYLAIIKTETQRLIKLVNDLLDLSKMQSGHYELQPILFNFSEQVRRVIAKMEPLLTNSQVDIHLIAEEDMDIQVWADPERIEQVLFNLLQNSIHFSHPRGTIEVTLRKMEGAAHFEIRDYGIGMNEQELKFIWDRFYKVDKARSKKSGTGIGLSIVKQILELHDSPIKVISEPGKGTSFLFSLPLKEPQHRDN